MLVHVDFEDLDIGAEPSAKLNLKNTVSNSEVVSISGNHAWRVDWDNTNKGEGHGYNVDKNPKALNPAITYKEAKSIVLEVSYYIDENAIGQTESQLYNVKHGTATPTTTPWNNVFFLDFLTAGKDATLKYSSKSATVKRGCWNTISVVLNLETSAMDFYVNGEYKFSASLYENDGENLEISEKNWIVGKINYNKSSTIKGSIYLDNIKMFKGTEPSSAPLNTLTFYGWNASDEEMDDTAKEALVKKLSGVGFASVPALCRIGSAGNKNALFLGMGVASAEGSVALYNSAILGEEVLALEVKKEDYHPEAGYLVCNGMEYTIYQDSEDSFPYIKHLTSDNSFVKYEIFPAKTFEAAIGGANVGKPLVYQSAALSYKDTGYALLEGDFFIEEGSTGVIESQLGAFTCDVLNAYGMLVETKNVSGLSLFAIDVATGKITNENSTNSANVALDVGAWNNVKVLVNLKNGMIKVYVNGVQAIGFVSGYENITLDTEWNAAVVKPSGDTQAAINEGFVAVDNFRTTMWYIEETATVSEMFLSDEAFQSYVAGAITQIDLASVRLGSEPGLRFATAVNDNRIQVLNSIFGADNVKLGTMISPDAYLTGYLTDNKVENVSRADLDAASADLGRDAYIDVAYGGEYFTGDVDADYGNNRIMVGSITNIKKENVDRAFAGIGYLEVTVNGEVYGEYTDATTRCVKDVAAAALLAYENGEVEYDASALAVLNAYAQGN